MYLSDLIYYANTAYGIKEVILEDEAEDISIFLHPDTGRRIAVLMRIPDPETGELLERCDLACGQQVLYDTRASWLYPPFLMRGQEWVGIRFDARTNPQAVYRLFDASIHPETRGGYTFSPRGTLLADMVQSFSMLLQTLSRSDSGPSGKNTRSYVSGQKSLIPNAPKKIRQMIRLYEFGDSSYRQKCRNFVRQARFMEDYEDDYAWSGSVRQEVPSYHDLNIPQLRAYFTWRTKIRKGQFQRTIPAFYRLYLSELINGIGAASPEEALTKMTAFRDGYLRVIEAPNTAASHSPEYTRLSQELSRWMLDYAILENLPAETVMVFEDPVHIERDLALSVLREPDAYTDAEVFDALVYFYNKKLAASSVIKKNPERGKHLFAALWRKAARQQLPIPPGYEIKENFYYQCFGKLKRYTWRPLANALYEHQSGIEPREYILNPSRRYVCENSLWQVEHDNPLAFSRSLFCGFLHEADRAFRIYTKSGSRLKEKPEEAWAAVFVSEFIAENQAAEEAEQIQAARLAVTIDLSSLEKIRRDALTTQDSLLVEEEETTPGAYTDPITETPENNTATPAANTETPAESTETPEKNTGDDIPAGLDETQIRILQALLAGASAEELLREKHLTASLVADAINEALLDEIGDIVLETDGDTLTLIEDYREDLVSLLT